MALGRLRWQGVFTGALVALCLCSAQASARQTHLKKETFPPSFSNANSLAFDQGGEQLLVLDSAAKTISRWNADGSAANFSALGTNVIDGAGSGAGPGTTGVHPCVSPTPPAECDETQPPQNGFSFGVFAGEEQVAVDNSGTATDGDIYVAQPGFGGSVHLVDIFAPSGEYLGRLTGTSGGSFGSPSYPCGVAVDSAGRLFVADQGQSKIYKYTPTSNPPTNTDGALLTSSVPGPCNLVAGVGPSAGFLFANRFFGNAGNSVLRVNATSGSNEGVVDEGEDRLVAVDPGSGRLLAARPVATGLHENFPGEESQAETVGEYLAAGGLPGAEVARFKPGVIKGIAVNGSNGDVYVSRIPGGSIAVYGPLLTVPDVTTDPGEVKPGSLTSVYLNGTVDPDGEEVTACLFEYGLTASYGEEAVCGEYEAGGEWHTLGSPSELGTGTEAVPVRTELNGLSVETQYHFRALARNANAALYPEDPEGTSKGEDETITTPSKPTIKAQWAASVEGEAATLCATINPGNTETEYLLRYGPEGGPVEEIGPVSIGGGEADRTPCVSLEGLTPGTTYRYRFLAENALGTVEGPELAFHTPLEVPEGLPDGRAYELVSPTDKEGGEAGPPASALNAAGAASTTPQPRQSTADGEAVTYGSFTAFEDPESAPATSQYLSKRTEAGWATDNVDPLFEEGYLRDPLVGFTDDLLHGAVYVIEPELTEDAAENVPDLYWRESSGGSLAALVTKSHQPALDPEVKARGLLGGGYCLYFGGASADGARVFFAAKGGLLEGDPVTDGFNLYEWAGGSLRLASVLPSGGAASPTLATGFGRGGDANCVVKGSLLRNAISADGRRAVWTYAHSYKGASSALFDRIEGSHTVQLDAVQGGSAPHGGEGAYWDASADGSKVFFSDPNKLTPGSTAEAGKPDLYRYDFQAPEGEELSDLSAPNPLEAENDQAAVKGVIGASREGSYAYFVAAGVLSGEEENEAGEKATAGQNNLYAWHEGEGVRFIAKLAGNDSSDWTSDLTKQSARVTPDGRHLALQSQKSLTGYDNTDLSTGNPDPQSFIYDYATGSLSCATCDPSGARPHGPSGLLAWSAPYTQPRYLSDDGARLFFESPDALGPGDANERRDVYEFERPGTGECTSSSPAFSAKDHGCLYLISTGKSPADSYLIDASSDGRDVFFSTRSRLFGADRDERYDVYDARVGGGFPFEEGEECEGHCPGAGTAAPAPEGAGTEAFQGPESPKPRHLPDCRPAARRAQRLSHRARALRHRARRLARHHRRHPALRDRRASRRLAKRARRLAKRTRRCRAVRRRASR